MRTEAIAYPLSWRIMAAALIAISRGSLPVLLALVYFSSNPPIMPLMLVRALVVLSVTPGIAAWLIEHAYAVVVEVEDDKMLLHHPERRIEIRCSAITRIDPWAVPLPGSGLWLHLQGGRRFRYGLQMTDPTGLLDALAQAGAREPAQVARQHPMAAYAHAKHSGRPRRWYHVLGKFVGFALVPTLPLFRVHQHIAYGGTFGQYYLMGLAAYLRTFAVYWGTLTLYLVLYAALWRGVAEAVAWGAAWVAPSRVARVRQAVEIGHRIAYYGGVPALVIIRFLPW